MIHIAAESNVSPARPLLHGLQICSVSAVLLLIPSVKSAWGQHDPQRNSVRHIAAGNFDKVDKELSKGDQDAPETHFVRMLNSLGQKDIPKAVSHAKAALDAGLPFGRLVAGPRDVLAPLYATPEFEKWSGDANPEPLLHGPMVGSVTGTGASFWLRTARESKVAIRVVDPATGEQAAASGVATTGEENDFVAVLPVSGLNPSTKYNYEVLIDGKSAKVELPSFRTFPAKGNSSSFSVAFGGGAGYVPEWEYMWDTIRQSDPLAMLMLGDNVYIDDPTQPLTNRYCYYRRQSRPEWRRFISSRSIFSIWDDHDFGTNDCVPGPEIESPAWKRSVWNMFRQNWVNPGYGGGESQPGCWYDFYIGDVHFILLDGRYYRTRKPTPSMLGPVQLKWLKETLKNSRGTFKVLASPVPFTEKIKPGSRDPWDGFADEREDIFSFIEDQKLDGVFLVAADRHRTDLRITKRDNGYDLYEFESSRLTNHHTHGVVKTPGLVWGYNKTCSFGLMKFDTTKDDPEVRFEAITIDGERVHDHTLKLNSISN